MVQLTGQQASSDPLARVGLFFKAAATSAQQSPLGVQVLGAVSQFKARHGQAQPKRRFGGASSPRIVVLPRDRAFAAILPGDSIAEQVRAVGGMGGSPLLWSCHRGMPTTNPPATSNHGALD